MYEVFHNIIIYNISSLKSMLLFNPNTSVFSTSEAMTGRTAPSSDGLLAEVSWGFPQL